MILDVPDIVPATADAVIVTISTYNSEQNDHVNHSFGRSYEHDPYTWDNAIHDGNTYYNDVLITNNGDSAGDDTYGYSHGTQIVPLDEDGDIQAYLAMGHSRGTT
eukprot:UN05961